MKSYMEYENLRNEVKTKRKALGVSQKKSWF